MTAKYRIGIVSQSPIADDPRVRRQGDALQEAGWEVVAIGLDGGQSESPTWRILTPTDVQTLPAPPSMPVTDHKTKGLRAFALHAFDWIAARRPLQLSRSDRILLSVRIDRRRAETIYWMMNTVFWDLLALGKTQSVDLWLGNDWTSLPIVARLARMQGVPFAYDTHELAADEFNENNRWRFVERPIRLEVEGAFIKKAAMVSTVSESIATRLAEIYHLAATPITVRSTPNYQAFPFRSAGDRIRVLYHGAVREHRGLEASIRSVSKWRPEFELTIRGPMSDAYRDILDREIDVAGVRGRVQLVAAVPMTELVREASAFDIGLFALPAHSNHNRFALPNKLFEFIMAGLALCVSNLQEMACLIRQFDVGALLHSTDDNAIAVAINGLDRAKIDYYKQKSLLAAQTLCWEHEKLRMLEAYDRIAANCQNFNPS